MTPTVETVIKARQVLEKWKAHPVGYHDYAVEFVRAMHATDAPPLIKPLMERNDRLEYLLARLQPTACTCEVEGPDGIECLRCEVAAEVGHAYPEAQRKAEGT